MDYVRGLSNRWSSWAITAAGFGLLGVVLWILQTRNFLLFHSLAELFSVVVAFATCVVAWYSRDWIGRNYLLLLGLSQLFVGIIDMVHTLSYKGIGVFEANGGNLSSQLWLSARTLEALSFLVAVWSPERRYNVPAMLAVLTLASSLLVASAFGGWWPTTFVDGIGVTPFKAGYEIALSLLFLGVLIRLRRSKVNFETQIYGLLVLCLSAKVMIELSFVGYKDVHGIANFIGHWLKIAGALFLLKAVVDMGLRRPHALIFGAIEREKLLSADLAHHAVSLDAILNATEYPVVLFDAEGRIQFVSRAAERFFGRTSRELVALTWRQAGLPEAVMGPLERLRQQALDLARPQTLEFCLPLFQGGIWLDVQVSPVGAVTEPKAVVAFIRDITARKVMEHDLKASLDDNRVLMAEVHHRVKNNLQIVSSILQMQGWRMTDLALRAQFEEACGRILSLAKVHELLYKQESVASVDFALYAKTLCGELFRMYGVREDWVTLDIDAATLPLAVDRAEPLALILHELVSNALKHAFTEQGGVLGIRVARSDDGGGLVVVADNGGNVARVMDFHDDSAALGLRMVGVLAKQIHGTVSVHHGAGTEVQVRFPLGEPALAGAEI